MVKFWIPQKQQRSRFVNLKLSSMLFFGLVLSVSCSKKISLESESVSPSADSLIKEYGHLFKGNDLNGDGIRDDVNLWIDTNIKDKSLKKASERYAFEYFKLVYSEDTKLQEEAFLKMNELDDCLMFLSVASEELPDRTFQFRLNEITMKNEAVKTRRNLVFKEMLKKHSRIVGNEGPITSATLCDFYIPDIEQKLRYISIREGGVSELEKNKINDVVILNRKLAPK